MTAEQTRKDIEYFRAERQKTRRRAQEDGSLDTIVPSWGQVATRAVQNTPKSAIKYAEDMVTPITEPVETAKGLWSFTKGVVQLAIPGEQEDEETVKAVGNYFVNRYGSVDQFKVAFADDPVGVLGDVAGVVTGGGMIAAKAPGMIGKAGQKAVDLGQKIDPLNIAVEGGQLAKKGVTDGVPAALGVTTGSGADAIKTSFDSGRAGGEADRRFVENLRGQEDPGLVVNDALENLRAMKDSKQNTFLSSREALRLEQIKVDFDALAAKTQEWSKKWVFEGQSELSPKGQAKLKAVTALINDWQKSPALHNAKGLDVLKRRIDNEYPTGINPGDEAVVVAQVRDMVKNHILESVPDYQKVMAPYEEASRLERELQKSLSLSDKASADTTLRKLQSVMRNNVNANFGQRLKLVEKLENAGDYFLLPRIAGQNLSSMAPRGLAGQVSAAGTALGGVATSPGTLAALPLFSPRLVGEASRAAGKTIGAMDKGAAKVADMLPDVNLTPGQRELLSTATPQRLQAGAQAMRLGGAIANEETPQQMSQEEFERLMLLHDQQQLLMQ